MALVYNTFFYDVITVNYIKQYTTEQTQHSNTSTESWPES